MVKAKYESPKFEFQEMRLLERVAAKCWGNDSPLKGYYDVNGNGIYDTGDYYFNVDTTVNSCPDKGIAVVNWLKEKYPELQEVNIDAANVTGVVHAFES